MDMDDKSIANMAVLAGEIMLRSGAETYRVEDTIKHILDTAGAAGGSAATRNQADQRSAGAVTDRVSCYADRNYCYD